MVLPNLTPQSAVIGFLDEPLDTFSAVNHVLIIFKIFLFKNRAKNPSVNHLVARIKNIAKIEGQQCFTERSRVKHNHKWGFIFNL